MRKPLSIVRGTDREHPQTRPCAADDEDASKRGARFFSRSKRGTSRVALGTTLVWQGTRRFADQIAPYGYPFDAHGRDRPVLSAHGLNGETAESKRERAVPPHMRVFGFRAKFGRSSSDKQTARMRRSERRRDRRPDGKPTSPTEADEALATEPQPSEHRGESRSRSPCTRRIRSCDLVFRRGPRAGSSQARRWHSERSGPGSSIRRLPPWG
jgi:hypothetical protein